MSKKLVKREITDAVDILLEGVDVLEQGGYTGYRN